MAFPILQREPASACPGLMRTLCFLLLFSFLSSGSTHAGPASDADTKTDQMKRIETELSREKEQYRKFGEKEKSLLGKLSDLEKAIAEKRGVLKELKAKLDATGSELREQQEKLKESQRSLGEVEERLSRRLLAFYKYAKRGYVHLFATSQGLDQLRKRVKYLQIILKTDRDLLGEMGAVLERHEKEVAKRRENLVLVERMKKAEGERMAALKKDLDEKVLLLMKIHKEKEFYETAVQELQLAAENLKDTLLNLEKRPKKTDLKRELPEGFEKLKGSLPLPFEGKILRNHDPLATGNRTSHKGIYIRGPSGADIRAIFPGRVDFSGWLKGYGQIIVINHGSRFFTVSAHLSERFKEEGEAVAKGEVIGLLGESESLAGPGLYFEIRKGGVPLDPSGWLKVD